MKKSKRTIKIFFRLSIISFVFSHCNNAANTPLIIDTHCKCTFKINPENFDSVHLYIDFGRYATRLLSLQKNDEEDYITVKGSIKSMEETTSEINLGFDEVNEDLKKKAVYSFNKNGLLDTIKQYNFDKNNMYLEYKEVLDYYPNNLLSNKTRIYYNYNERSQYNRRYTYSESGLKTKELFEISNEFINSKTNFYKNYQVPFKQTYTERNLSNSLDSTVIKYFYDSCLNLEYLYIYDANGNRRSAINFGYSEGNNSINVTTRIYNLLSFTDEASTVSDINYYMDSNCTIKEITEVQMIDELKKEKLFSRISINKYNNVTEVESFKLKTPDNTNLKFIRDLNNYEPTFLEHSNIQIQYDARLNWIMKKINDKVIIKRKIVYRN